MKTFSFEIYKSHYNLCIEENNMKQTILDNSSFKKVKLKILKGLLAQNEMGTTYMEYIIEVSYNLQTWRLNKKFSQFVNFQSLLKRELPRITFPDTAELILKVDMHQAQENRLKFLDQYIKDISNINDITQSKVFKNFFGFEEHYDEEEDFLNGHPTKVGEKVNPMNFLEIFSSEDDDEEEFLKNKFDAPEVADEDIVKNKDTNINQMKNSVYKPLKRKQIIASSVIKITPPIESNQVGIKAKSKQSSKTHLPHEKINPVINLTVQQQKSGKNTPKGGNLLNDKDKFDSKVHNKSHDYSEKNSYKDLEFKRKAFNKK